MRSVGYAILMVLMTVPQAMAVYSNSLSMVLSKGEMEFKGRVIAETCAVAMAEQNLYVVIGQVRTNQFLHVGHDVHSTPVNLHLKDCHSWVRNQVGIVIEGIADVKNPEVLSIREGGGTASGVAIALFDARGAIIPINSHPRTRLQLGNGGVGSGLNLMAKYRSVSQEVLGGSVNAQALFALTYL